MEDRQLGTSSGQLDAVGTMRSCDSGIPRPPQVGVISWGVVDVCKHKRRQRELPPAYARDFHVNLFQVLPWLKEKLQDEDLGFL